MQLTKAEVERDFGKSFSVRRALAQLSAYGGRWRRDGGESASRVFQDLFAVAPIPIVLLSGPELTIELANDAAVKAIGRASRGRPLADVLPEIKGQGCIRALREVMATGVPFVREETFIGIDERRPPFRGMRYWTFSCVRWSGRANGEAKVVVVFSDVTAQVNARKSLEAVAADVERASAAKDRFLAVLGHELRDPLSPIMSALELMRLRGDSTPERALIERQAKQLTRLVDDLLDVSRIERGKVELKRRPVDLREVVLESIETVGPLLEKQRQQLDLDLPRGLGIDADPDRMRQVVSNLLTNAAKYSEPGSPIAVSAYACGDKVRLSVVDRGIGIERDKLGEVFDVFAQHGLARDGARVGLGLGLAIVRSLVHLHGGEVYAHSEGLDKGSEFVVQLARVALDEPNGQ